MTTHKTHRIRILIGAALVGGTMTIGAGAQAYWDDPWGSPWSEPGWGGGPWSEPGWGGGPWSEPGWGGGPWSEPGWGGGPGSEPGWGGGPGSEPGWGGGPGSEPGWGGGGPWSEPGYPYSGYGQALDQTHERQSEMRDHRAAMRSVARMLSGRRNFDRAEAIGLARAIEASAGENLVRLFEPSEAGRSPLSRARIGDEMEAFKAHADALQEAAGELADALEKRPSAEDIEAGRAWSPEWRYSRRGWGMAGPYSRGLSEREALTPEVLEAYTKLRGTCHGCHANFRSRWR